MLSSTFTAHFKGGVVEIVWCPFPKDRCCNISQQYPVLIYWDQISAIEKGCIHRGKSWICTNANIAQYILLILTTYFQSMQNYFPIWNLSLFALSLLNNTPLELNVYQRIFSIKKKDLNDESLPKKRIKLMRTDNWTVF